MPSKSRKKCWRSRTKRRQEALSCSRTKCKRLLRRYDELRSRLADQISQINSVANYDGKGRDDLSIKILTSAESMLRTISPNQSKSVRKLAENIRSSFYNIRRLL